MQMLMNSHHCFWRRVTELQWCQEEEEEVASSTEIFPVFVCCADIEPHMSPPSCVITNLTECKTQTGNISACRTHPVYCSVYCPVCMAFKWLYFSVHGWINLLVSPHLHTFVHYLPCPCSHQVQQTILGPRFSKID